MRKMFFTGRVEKYWNRIPREVMESPSSEISKIMWILHQGEWFSGEHGGGAGLVIGIKGLKGLFRS